MCLSENRWVHDDCVRERGVLPKSLFPLCRSEIDTSASEPSPPMRVSVSSCNEKQTVFTRTTCASSFSAFSLRSFLLLLHRFKSWLGRFSSSFISKVLRTTMLCVRSVLSSGFPSRSIKGQSSLTYLFLSIFFKIILFYFDLSICLSFKGEIVVYWPRLNWSTFASTEVNRAFLSQLKFYLHSF